MKPADSRQQSHKTSSLFSTIHKGPAPKKIALVLHRRVSLSIPACRQITPHVS